MPLVCLPSRRFPRITSKASKPWVSRCWIACTNAIPRPLHRQAHRIRAVAAAGDSWCRLPDRQLPALEVISVMGVGYDGVDLPAALERGVCVGHTPGVLNDDVADLALALMLAVSRGIVGADAHVRAGRWHTAGRPLQRKMSGARLGCGHGANRPRHCAARPRVW